MSSPALAESGVPDAPVSVPDVADVATAVLEEAGLTELDPATAVDVLPATLPAVPAQTTAAEPVPVGAVIAPPPEPAVEAPAEAAPVANPLPDVPPSATVTQTAPANVNVSVRVDSPGDDGSVEQVNVAAAEPASQQQPEAPQYQDPIPAPDAPAAQTAAPEPAAPAEGWNWTWEWNCGDAPPEIPIPADVPPQNWTWNWDWNCDGANATTPNSEGENTAQYQPVVTQYRPININISIRINSPGNNGAVHQTNVAVALTPPALPQLRVEAPAASPNQPQSAFVFAADDPLAPLALMAAVVDGFGADPSEQRSDEGACCALREPGGAAASASEPESVLLPQAPPASERDITPRGRFRASVDVTIRIASATEAAARSARPAPKPAQLRPAPRRPVAPPREQAAALSAAGLAPLNASDGRLGQLVFLVAAFAFAIAFAEASRSVAAEVRAAGEDPDPPPDHPG